MLRNASDGRTSATGCSSSASPDRSPELHRADRAQVIGQRRAVNRPGRQLDDERRRARERVIRPRRRRPRQERQAGRPQVRRAARSAAPRRDHHRAMSTRSMCWWYQIVTAGLIRRISAIAARVSGSEGRMRAGVVGRIRDRLPLVGEVAVEVDAVGVLTGVGGGAVGVHLGHEPQLDALDDRRALERGDDREAGALVAVDAADHEDLAARVARAHARSR